MNKLPTKQEMEQTLICTYLQVLRLDEKYRPLVEAERARRKAMDL